MAGSERLTQQLSGASARERPLQRLVSLRLRLWHGLEMLVKPLSEDFTA
jgi:hypothetical protein